MGSINIEFDQAEMYELISSPEREDGYRMIDLLTPIEVKRILDLGCGTGYFSKILKNITGPDSHVVGVDPDIERLEVARKKYSVRNVEYLHGTAEKIPSVNFKFDMVFSNHVLHWCKDKDLVLKQVSQCLKKGGMFAFVSVHSCASLIEMLSRSTEGKDLMRGFRNKLHHISDVDFKDIAISNGFVVDYWNTEIQEYIIKDGDAFIDFLRTHFQFDEFGSSLIDIFKNSCTKDYDLCPKVTFCILRKV